MVIFLKFLFLFLITQSFLFSKEVSEEDFINTLTKFTIKEESIKNKIMKISSDNFSKYQNIYNEKKIYFLTKILLNEIENYEMANNLCQLVFLEKNYLSEKINKKNKNENYKELENCNIEFELKKNEIDNLVGVLKNIDLFMKTNKLEWIVVN